MIKLAVPAGIGDVSWIWSKFCTLNEPVEIFVPWGYPARTYPWLSFLKGVKPGIGRHGYNDILINEMRKGELKTWKEIKDNHLEDEIIYIQPNQHFLQGGTLEEWLPDLDTNFHYPMDITHDDQYSGLEKLDMSKNPYSIGIHMACRRGNKAWETWYPEQWETLIRAIAKDFPEVTFVLLGGLWDLDNGMELLGRLGDKIKVLDLIGKTNIGEAITILDKLNYFIGYSSGLNVLMNVLNKPCTALWPSWQDKHMYGWADPKMIEKREYLGFQYDDPMVVYYRVKDTIKRGLRNG